MLNHSASKSDFAHARTVMPGGVNSPVRAFAKVDCDPVFYDHARGCRVWDVDGNEYRDFICSWGPMIFGHGDPDVMDAVRAQLDRGVSYGAPCEAELRLADKICEVVPNVEQVRMVSSGTEATMTAIRLARGYTHRDKLIKFAGNYHGHSDSLLVSAGSGVATLGIPGTPGVTAGTAADTLVARYNDVDSVRQLMRANPGEVAAVIVEPVSGNMGVVPPEPGFLQGLREACDESGALLIMDEVITGFRVALGGAQQLFGVRGDLVTFGKIIGAGFPVGCIAGPERIMESLAPDGPVYQAGTLSGNPVAMEAGLAQLTKLCEPGVYDRLNALGARLADELRDAIAQTGAHATVNQCGSLATVFFTDRTVRSWDDAAACDTKAFARYFDTMLDEGFLIAPSQFEALFVSLAHTDQDIDAFGAAARKALEGVVASRADR
ncbi:MAG: glutamate-1-semialdehyde 2,1-aminomutase [Coriobacteriales bacterium]|jgi:glutamate-1-semialdehyde 2,1-aminomutase